MTRQTGFIFNTFLFFWGLGWGPEGHGCAAWPPWMWIRFNKVTDGLVKNLEPPQHDFYHSKKVLGAFEVFFCHFQALMGAPEIIDVNPDLPRCRCDWYPFILI